MRKKRPFECFQKLIKTLVVCNLIKNGGTTALSHPDSNNNTKRGIGTRTNIGIFQYTFTRKKKTTGLLPNRSRGAIPVNR
jgi:hypothetical protein